MKTNLTIKNFKIFDESGASIDLSPITILTGCNGAGKSSIVKAVLLLNSFLSQIRTELENGNIPHDIGRYRLDFSSAPLNTLGRFEKVLHNGTAKSIILEYTVYSYMLSSEVTVSLVFCKDENDALDNGYLSKLELSTNSGVFYCSSRDDYSSPEKKPFFNLNIVKGQCLDFLEIEHLIQRYLFLIGEYEVNDSLKQEDYYRETGEIIDSLKSFDAQRRKDVIHYVRKRHSNTSIVDMFQADPGIIKWTRNNGSYFRIPILSILNDKKKADFSEFPKSEIFADDDKVHTFMSLRVIKDFLESDFEIFGDYFMSYETKYYDHFTKSSFDLTDFFEKEHTVLRLPRKKDLSISQDYYYSYPGSYSVVALADEDRDKDEHSIIKEIEEWKNIPLSFPIIYETVMHWNRSHSVQDQDNGGFYSFIESGNNPFGEFVHTMHTLLSQFVSDLALEVICPEWAGAWAFSYAPSSRVTVKRLYSLDNNDPFSILLKNYFENKRVYSERTSYPQCNYVPGAFINKWTQYFLGTGKTVSLETDKEGLGIQIRLLQSPEDTEGRLLADEGFGVTQLIALLIQIETIILSADSEQIKNYYGLNLLDGNNSEDFRYAVKTIAIEEPEIHLHPAFQSKLADMLIDAFINYNIHFIVETHSEYLIRKLQLYIPGVDIPGIEQNISINSDDVSILYVNGCNSTKENGEPLVKQIHICPDGYLDDNFGTGFFDEATILSRKLL